MKWEKSILSISKILEDPNIEKGYEDLKNYYESNNLQYESDCISYLIKEKFNNVNNTNISKK